MYKLPTVREFMDRFVDTVSPDMDVLEAVEFLLAKRITGVPVVSAGEMVGILTETDCLKLLAKGSDHDMPRGKVADFMTREVRTVPSKMDIYYAAGIFLQVNFRRLPVVDDGELVGVITRFDILRAIRGGLGT
ncbi:MAG: CBS domain-containing protein [Deltaproteobacteria bacterium]|nr:MAG: CBS domain-containing protein [Deltaproteobacteria bacterium]